MEQAARQFEESAEGLSGGTNHSDAERLRKLRDAITPILSDDLPASLLLEVLESVRPGISIELETAIATARNADETLESGDFFSGLSSYEL